LREVGCERGGAVVGLYGINRVSTSLLDGSFPPLLLGVGEIKREEGVPIMVPEKNRLLVQTNPP